MSHPKIKAITPPWNGPGPLAVGGGILQRMGDVMGPGAVYSLVHYAAYEEGLKLGATLGDDTAAAARLIGAIFNLEVNVTESSARAVRIEIAPSAELSFETRGVVALIVGLLEGALTVTHRTKLTAQSEPAMDADGTLKIEFAG